MSGRILLVALSSVLGGRANALAGQDPPEPSAALSPYVGIGPIFDHGDLVSWSADLLLEIGVRRASWRWNAFGSVRGIGAACSDGCDLSGEGVGLGVTYQLRRIGFGGGMGMLRQSGRWHAQPHATLTAGRGAFRAQFRVEVPFGGFGVFVPVLVGVRLPVP
jgi:hypothetical protein